MDKILKCYLEQMILGEPWVRENLTVIPIFASNDEDASKYYLLLDEALEQGVFEAMEIDDYGHVNEIQVVNRADKPILIFDGEELIGAKQNRMVNTTLLIPAQVKMVIPVSCVESGRWHHLSAAFQSSTAFGYSNLRRQKTSQVTASLRTGACFAANQSAVWAEIDRKQAIMGSRSETSAMHEIYVNYEHEMQKYMEGMEARAGQIGVMVCINGMFNCLDVMGHSDSLRQVWNKLLRSYVMEALESREEKHHDQMIRAVHVLESLAQAKVEFYKSPGNGTDFRIQSEEYIGAGLIDREQVLHFSAFPAMNRASIPEGHIARPSRRRRNQG